MGNSFASGLIGNVVGGPTIQLPEVSPVSQLSGNFDGVDDYVAIDDAAGLAFDGDVSLSLWFNPASLPGSVAWDYMFSLTNIPGVGQDRAVGIRGTGTDAQIVGNTYGYGWNLPFTNTSIVADTWYNVVAVFTGDGWSGDVQIFLDGVDKGSKTVYITDPSGVYVETAIGSFYSPIYFDGLIDEVAVFNSALDQDDVTSIYNSGTPGDIESLGPIGWWRMGNGTGDTNASGGTPENTEVIGTVANQGTLGSSADGTGTNGPTFSNDVP